MKLRDYLDNRGMTIKHFAKVINYSYQHISNTMLGYKKAGRKFMEIVEKETKGDVTFKDWDITLKNPNQLEFAFAEQLNEGVS